MNFTPKNKLSKQKGGKKNLKISFLVLISFVSIFMSGCIFDEAQGVEISGDIGYSVGSISEDQTDIQKIQWTASVGNNGEITAKNVSCKVILHPEVSSRLIDLEGDTKHIGNLESDTWEGFKGNATFNAANLSKQDMDEWGKLIEVKVMWEENGEMFEKTIPDMVK